MTLEIIGLDEAIAQIVELEQAMAGLDQPLQEALDEHAGEAQGRAPIDTKTLHDSIEGVVEPQGKDWLGIVRAAVDYGLFVEFGTKPHFVPARFIGEWAEKHGFGFTGLFVSGKAQPFMRTGESDSLEEAAERLAKTAWIKIHDFIKRAIE
jgi:hypothetical protein